MNKRIKKKKSLAREVQQLRSDMLALSRENLDLYAKLTAFNSELSALRQSQERHETICGKNVEATNAEFDKIKDDLKQLKKPFWKR
ncbi:hypothetical protein D8798_00950 [Streptococcus cristatus]|uniref:Uncharacterized protein n=1 Tax=Streptococcus cristatus TaxID=45634 RepID=A0A3R9KTE6_STRCR|nr:hypothetical protein [Streptococcus cristatus]RSJ77726.1 hypothetical protein D8798_00950 [Streptococcus cristatus]